MGSDHKTARDEAGVGPQPQASRHLAPLRELRDWTVANGDPDIRGWSVFASNGRKLGTVDELLVDAEIGEVVLLEIALEDTDRRTMAPIRAAWVDRDHKRVILDGVELAVDNDLPSLGRTDVTAADVLAFDDRYERMFGDTATPADRAVEPARHVPLADAPPPADSELELPITPRPRESVRLTKSAFQPGERVIEEVVVRRRVVSADELADLPVGDTLDAAEPPAADDTERRRG